MGKLKRLDLFFLVVTEESREEPAFQNFMQESMAQYWKRNNK